MDRLVGERRARVSAAEHLEQIPCRGPLLVGQIIHRRKNLNAADGIEWALSLEAPEDHALEHRSIRVEDSRNGRVSRLPIFVVEELRELVHRRREQAGDLVIQALEPLVLILLEELRKLWSGDLVAHSFRGTATVSRSVRHSSPETRIGQSLTGRPRAVDPSVEPFCPVVPFCSWIPVLSFSVLSPQSRLDLPKAALSQPWA